MIPRSLLNPTAWACVALAAVVVVLIGLALQPTGAPDVDLTPVTAVVATVPALLPAVLGGKPALRNTQGVYLPAEPPPFMVRGGS